MKKNFLYSAFLLIAICAGNMFANAQQWVPDPGKTYGDKSTMRTTTSTNPQTLIPETKTEYKDENGTVRKETIQTKDTDGNNVTKEKIFDQSGTLIEESEVRKNATSGKMTFFERKKYGFEGRVIQADKHEFSDGKWHYYDYDYPNQKYKEPRIVSSAPKTKDESFACNSSKFNLLVGYSYLQTSTGNIKSFPAGVELGIGYRFSNKFRTNLDLSFHSAKKDDQTVQRVFILPGMEYKPLKPEQQPISVFGRIAIGMMHERYKQKGQDASGKSGFACGAGAGVDLKLGCRTTARISGDYLLAFINSDQINSARFGAGLIYDLDDKFKNSK